MSLFRRGLCQNVGLDRDCVFPEEYKCQLAAIVEKNRKMQGDYENLLKKVGEQVAVIGRLKGQADRAKTCPRCATLEMALRRIRSFLSRRLNTAHLHSAGHGEAFCDAMGVVNDYMEAVDVKPLAEEEKNDVTL